jgi:uncharacterized membrane protein
MSNHEPGAVSAGNLGLGHGQHEPAGRKLETGRGLEWLGQGWRLFMKNPGIWIAIQLIMMVIFIVLSFVPLLGGLAISLLFPVFIGGLMLGCASLAAGDALNIETLFAGFQHKNMGNLLLTGLLYLAGTFVIGAVVVLVALFTVGGAGLLALASGTITRELLMTMIGGALLAVLIALALLVPLMMAIYFAPQLVVFRDLGPFDAMKASFSGCLKNILPFLLYGVIVFVLGLVAMIPMGLGMLVLGPVLTGSAYAAYMDIFE